MTELPPTTTWPAPPSPASSSPTRPLASPPPCGSRAVLPVRLLTAGLGVLVLLFGSVSVAGTFFLRHQTLTRTFAPAVHEVQVTANGGDVHVHPAAAGSPTVVVAHLTNAFRTGTHSETVSDGVLKASGSCRGGGWTVIDGCSVDFDITVGQGSAVRISDEHGDVTVTGINGSIVVSTSHGDVRLSRDGGTVSATTDNGDVKADRLSGGTVSASSDNGDVRLLFATAPGNVSATSDNGDVHVGVPNVASGYRVQAETGNGDRSVTVPLTSSSGRRIYAKSSNGDVEVSPEP